MAGTQETQDQVAEITGDYKYGFVTDVDMEMAPKGLSEDIVRFISAKKEEPEWLLDWRLKAYRAWLKMEEPDWAKVSYPKIDYDDIYYYAAPKSQDKPKSLDEVDPELLRTYEKLGIPLAEQEVLAGVEGARKVAVDAVFDSVSVATTFREELKKSRRRLYVDLGSGARTPRTCAEVSRHRCAAARQLFRCIKLRRFLRRYLCLYPKRRALPDGTLHLFPHQCRKHGAV